MFACIICLNLISQSLFILRYDEMSRLDTHRCYVYNAPTCIAITKQDNGVFSNTDLTEQNSAKVLLSSSNPP